MPRPFLKYKKKHLEDNLSRNKEIEYSLKENY
jgi:hypothetical protein